MELSGIRLRRDNYVSVRYAEELNAGKSSAPYSALTDRTFWDKSLRIFKSLRDNTTQSVRQLARHTGLSTSRVQRLKHAMERRANHPESEVWEREAGRQWLRRLVVATLSVFGLTCGVGLDTIRAFLTRVRLDGQIGGSPTA